MGDLTRLGIGVPIHGSEFVGLLLVEVYAFRSRGRDAREFCTDNGDHQGEQGGGGSHGLASRHPNSQEVGDAIGLPSLRRIIPLMTRISVQIVHHNQMIAPI